VDHLRPDTEQPLQIEETRSSDWQMSLDLRDCYHEPEVVVGVHQDSVDCHNHPGPAFRIQVPESCSEVASPVCHLGKSCRMDHMHYCCRKHWHQQGRISHIYHHISVCRSVSLQSYQEEVHSRLRWKGYAHILVVIVRDEAVVCYIQHSVEVIGLEYVSAVYGSL